MRKSIFLFALFCLACSVQIVAGQSQKEKDRAAFISNTGLLAERPFDPNAAAARKWGFKYVADTDEVTVVLCSDTMMLIPEKKNKFKGELLMQFTFEMAVFKLQTPERKADESAAQLAGLEGMLRTYQKMVLENEKARNAELDSLVAKRDNGELKALVDAAKCEDKSGK